MAGGWLAHLFGPIMVFSLPDRHARAWADACRAAIGECSAGRSGSPAQLVALRLDIGDGACRPVAVAPAQQPSGGLARLDVGVGAAHPRAQAARMDRVDGAGGASSRCRQAVRMFCATLLIRMA